MPEHSGAVHLAYDWMIVSYFFLGGISAGAFIFSVIANYRWKQDFKSLAKKGAVLSLITLAAGMLMLLLHLGHIERAWRVLVTFNSHSMLSWGTWILTIFGLINLIYIALLFKGKEDTAKMFGCLGMFFALLAATYTALHIARAPDKLLWHSSLMPILFLNGAIISGIAIVMLFSATDQNAQLLLRLGKLVAWLVVFEVSMVFAEVVMLFNGGTESIAVARSLLSGEVGFLFLGVEIVIGAVVPVTILLMNRSSVFLRAVASLLILIGIFTMRYVVVVGGQLIIS